MTAKLMKPSGHKLPPIKQQPTANMTQTTMVTTVLNIVLLTLKQTHIDFPASHPAPFSTQFFQEDDFGGGFDDDGGFDGEGRSMLPEDDAGEQDLLAATQGQTRRVRPEFVNYARRAKRVDVRKLKENIWKGLGIVVPQDKDEAEEGSMVSISYLIPD
jgi:hypothetical protein